jgi:hypothetical protein
VTHYEVLGVTSDAGTDEIRRAYLHLAREHHPDHHGDPERMQAINAAWHVLSDPVRRRSYDDALDTLDPVPSWRPFDDGWEVDEPDPRLDDSNGRRPTGGRLLALAPAALLVVGVAALIVGGVANVRGLLALAFICLAGAAVLFVVAPLAVILESRRHDRL